MVIRVTFEEFYQGRVSEIAVRVNQVKQLAKQSRRFGSKLAESP